MSPGLFFSGSVQEAVQATIQHQKYLVAFVTDEKDESITWQNEFLPEIRHHLEENAVTLRLVAGSQDAAYLASMFPIPKFPTVILIHQGQLKDYLPAGLTKDDFISRANKAFSGSQTTIPAAGPSISQPQRRQPEAQGDSASNLYANDDPAMDLMDPSAAAQLEAYRAAAAEREAARLQAEEEAKKAEKERKKAEEQARRERELQERHRAEEAAAAERRRLEERRREQVAIREAQRAARREAEDEATQKALKEGEARRKAAAEKAARERKEKGTAHKPQLSAAEKQHRDEVLKQKADIEKERKRILAEIETDKADRRHREEARRMNREQLKKLEAEEAAAEQAEIEKRKRIFGVVGEDEKTCALQVRLLDGGIVRARFGGSSTLKEHVRPWVDRSVLEKVPSLKRVPPYRLKMILTPKPNVTFLPPDEQKTIVELGMAPTATLVVVHSDGITGTGGVDTGGLSHGPVWDRIKFFFFLVGIWLSGIWSRFMALFTYGQRGAEQDDQHQHNDGESRENAAHDTRAKATGVDRRGDDGQRRRREQYYNGNSTAFEARPDDEPKD